MRWLQSYGLYLAWLIAVLASAGSLILSEVVGFVPCTLCWYQRICMYPLALMLGIASYRSDRQFVIYALPLTVLGAGIALFHYLEQKVPDFGFPELCKVGVPCNVQYLNWAGFITIPFMSLTAFVLVAVLLIVFASVKEDENE